MFPRIRTVIALTAALTLAVVSAHANPPARKKDDLQTAIKTLASEVKELMEQERQETIAVGDFQFQGAAQNASFGNNQTQLIAGVNFGPGLKNMFANELSAQKVSVSGKAHLTVQSSYKLEKDEKDIDGTQVKVSLEATVKDSSGIVRGTYNADIRTNADIARLLGVTTSHQANENSGDRNEKIQDAAKKPTVFVNGAIIKATADSPFSVELLVNKQPRAATTPDGQAFVDILRDEVYAVKVTNDSDHEAAITLNIDGFDAFAFSEELDPQTKRPKFSHYIVAKHTSMVIQGWHKTTDRSRSDNVLGFLVTEYEKSLHFSEKSSGPVGVLTVTFALSGTQPSDLPHEDAKSARNNGTAFGPPIKENQTPLKRIFGDIHDVVTVRYTR